MEKLIINGKTSLEGRVRVHGSKNAVLPILAATILTGGENVISDCPPLKDVLSTIKILRHLGCEISYKDSVLTLDADNAGVWEIPETLMRELRSSIIFLGAVASKMGRAVISYPGGCELGPRPIDLHIKALSELGMVITEEDGYILADASGMRGGTVHLSFPSVGATENIMLTAVKAKGKTVITNAAREPEIVDLANFLNRAGAKIKGAGSERVEIEGVASLSAVDYTVIPDRIVAATYLCAAMSAGGEIEIENIVPSHMDAVMSALKDCGAKIETFKDVAYIRSPKKIKPVSVIKTQPYPGFPTDAQSLIIPVLCFAEGCSVIVENIFESRYKILPELKRMGADIVCDGRVAVVRGVKRLNGARVSAMDLRGGAALVVAALGAHGESVVENAGHIDRGYDNLLENLRILGADIRER